MLAPCAWAQSSTSAIFLARQMLRRRSKSRGTKPARCTTTSAAVRSVIRFTASSTSRQKSSGCMSQKTTCAFALSAAFTVATKVLAGMMTSRPSTPRWRKAISSAAVHDDSATACLVPTRRANSVSSSLVRGPRISRPERSTSPICSRIFGMSSSRKRGRAAGIWGRFPWVMGMRGN
jgi:hypothetical protein